MNKKSALFIVLTALLLSAPLPSLWSQGLYRNIAALKFHYYSDDRYGAIWEEVFITPLPKNLYLVTAATGENTSFSNINGGRIGLAFDLPGYYYGEAAYSLERNFDEEYYLHSVFLSTTYESGPAMASVSLTGEFCEESNGAIVSPGLRYFINPKLAASLKLFLALHDYTDDDTFFNFAVLGIGEYQLGPEILGSFGGTFGTEYEPDHKYGKWSVIGGIKVVPTDRISVLSQFEYTNSRAHPTNPHEIYGINFVTDIKFGTVKE